MHIKNMHLCEFITLTGEKFAKLQSLFKLYNS